MFAPVQDGVDAFAMRKQIVVRFLSCRGVGQAHRDVLTLKALLSRHSHQGHQIEKLRAQVKKRHIDSGHQLASLDLEKCIIDTASSDPLFSRAFSAAYYPHQHLLLVIYHHAVQPYLPYLSSSPSQ